jgi:hypothetical protein
VSNVVSLSGAPAMEAGEPDPNLIGELERLLELARSGEAQGIVGAFLYRDGTSASFNAGWRNRSLIGGLELQKHELIASMLGGDGE